MSYNLLLAALWTVDGRVDPDAGKRLMRKKIAEETDVNIIYSMSERVKLNNSLAVEVMLAEGLDGPLRKEWNKRVMRDLWDPLIDEMMISLHTSPEVTNFRLGNLVAYMTGGMSGGEDPTDAWALWSTLLYDDDPDFGNPYGAECYTAMGFLDTARVIPPEDWVAPQYTVQDYKDAADGLTVLPSIGVTPIGH